ncbi:hypothetical protein W627_00880, partial [Staphylococcus aureus VET0395R]
TQRFKNAKTVDMTRFLYVCIQRRIIYSPSHIGEQQMNHRIANHNQMPHSQITQSTHQVTAAEIEAMGGKVNTHSAHHHNKSYSQPSNQQQRLATDDDIGNGESIFDF